MDERKNFGISNLKFADETNFTSNIGMKLRRHLYRPLQVPLRKATDGNIILESIKVYDGESTVKVEKDLSFLQLDKNQPYIFVSTHSFCEDVNAALAIMDRNAYLLIGSTDQIDYNPTAYALWLNGFIYVNRLDPENRKNSILKMERLLNNGTSVIICAEGGYNNTENKVVERIFNGPYILNKNTGVQIVPIASFREPNSDAIYITADKPIDLSQLSKEDANRALRDKLASLMFELWIHHATRIKRADLGQDCRLKFMEERKNEYLKNKWTHDVWDEELTVYKDSSNPTPQEVRATLDSVRITPQNEYIFLPLIEERVEDIKHDFKRYMKQNWKK